MKPFRWLAAGLLWVLASLLGLVGVLLCVTVILIPVGLLLISLSRRLYGLAGRLVVPRALRHPVAELEDTGTKAGRQTRKELRRAAQDVAPSGKSLKKAGKSAR